MEKRKEKKGKGIMAGGVTALFIVLFLLAGCSGTVTVSLENASEIEGDRLHAVLYEDDEPSINTESEVVALNYGTVSSGTCTLTLEEEDTATKGNWSPGGTIWEGSGGINYDLYIYTDDNKDGDGEPATGAPGSSYKTKSMPISFTVKGDKPISIDFIEDMTEYTGGTFTAELKNAPRGGVLTVYVYVSQGDLGKDDCLGFGKSGIDGGTALVTAEKFPDREMAFYGTDTLMYDAYMFIDGNGNEEPDPGELVYKDWPYMYTQTGNRTVTIDGSTDLSEFD